MSLRTSARAYLGFNAENETCLAAERTQPISLTPGQCDEALQPMGTAENDCVVLGLAASAIARLSSLAPFVVVAVVVGGVSPAAAVVPPSETDTDLLLHTCGILLNSAADELAGALRQCQHGGGAPPLTRALPNVGVLSRDNEKPIMGRDEGLPLISVVAAPRRLTSADPYLIGKSSGPRCRWSSWSAAAGACGAGGTPGT